MGKKVKGHVECEEKLRKEGKTEEQDKEGNSVKDGVRDDSGDMVMNEPRVSLKDISESVEQGENKELKKSKECLETKTEKDKPLEEHSAEGEQLKEESRGCSGDDVKQRKKLSPCKKGKSVKAREIDLSVSRKEGTESGSHPGRERIKSDLYDKRKDRLGDSVARDD